MITRVICYRHIRCCNLNLLIRKGYTSVSILDRCIVSVAFFPDPSYINLLRLTAIRPGELYRSLWSFRHRIRHIDPILLRSLRPGKCAYRHLQKPCLSWLNRNLRSVVCRSFHIIVIPLRCRRCQHIIHAPIHRRTGKLTLFLTSFTRKIFIGDLLTGILSVDPCRERSFHHNRLAAVGDCLVSTLLDRRRCRNNRNHSLSFRFGIVDRIPVGRRKLHIRLIGSRIWLLISVLPCKCSADLGLAHSFRSTGHRRFRQRIPVCDLCSPHIGKHRHRLLDR